MEFIKKILKAHGIEADVIKAIMEDMPEVVAKTKYDKEKDRADGLAKEKVDLEAKVKDADRKDNQIEILETQVSDLKKDKQAIQDKYDKDMNDIRVKNYVKDQLGGKLKDGKYFELLYKEIETDKIKFKDDGSVEGFDVKPLEEKYPDLFGGDTGDNNPPRRKPGKGEGESLGEKLAKLNKTQTIKVDPYFGE
jgi:Phage minor structural protein GP20.